MIAYLLRHGQAGRAPRDSERALTEKGREEVSRIGRWLARGKLIPEHIHTSPYQRARETAEILSSSLGDVPMRVVPGMAPGVDVERMLEVLREPREKRGICLVGHMPDLGELAAFLAWGERGRVMDLSTATMVCARIEFQGSKVDSSLEWVMTPEEAG